MIHDADDLPDPSKAIYVGPGSMYTVTLQKHEVFTTVEEYSYLASTMYLYIKDLKKILLDCFSQSPTYIVHI